jgi:hypothetical protein
MAEPTPPPGQGAGPGEPRPPTPEEFMAELAYRLARTPVRDVLLQTMATFTDMAGIRLGLGPEGEGPKDLPQARLAIEALRALYAVAEEQLGAAQARPFREPLAQLQLAYARIAEVPRTEEGEPGAGAPPGPEAGGEPPPQERQGPDPASRLWVPPGHRR